MVATAGIEPRADWGCKSSSIVGGLRTHRRQGTSASTVTVTRLFLWKKNTYPQR